LASLLKNSFEVAVGRISLACSIICSVVIASAFLRFLLCSRNSADALIFPNLYPSWGIFCYTNLKHFQCTQSYKKLPINIIFHLLYIPIFPKLGPIIINPNNDLISKKTIRSD
jgi:hypothetical protein